MPHIWSTGSSRLYVHPCQEKCHWWCGIFIRIIYWMIQIHISMKLPEFEYFSWKQHYFHNSFSPSSSWSEKNECVLARDAHQFHWLAINYNFSSEKVEISCNASAPINRRHCSHARTTPTGITESVVPVQDVKESCVWYECEYFHIEMYFMIG